MDGWIKLHRKILSSKVWRGADADGKVILLTLLLRACHTLTGWNLPGGKTAVLKPGELLISNRGFAESCGVKVGKIRFELKRLEKLGFIKLIKKAEGTVVTICNWGVYQTNDTAYNTLCSTACDTPKNAGTELADGQKMEPKNTACDTPYSTVYNPHNKNYILLKNKLNKTDFNKNLLTDIAGNEDYRLALQRFRETFPTDSDKLDGILDVLCLYAGHTEPKWILKAVNELIAGNKSKKVHNPCGYLLGILNNWLNDGLPNDRLGAEKTLEDFYREAGVIE